MLDAFKAGGDFHSRTAMNMYQHIRDAVDEKKVLLEWHPQPGQEKPPVPLLKVHQVLLVFFQLWCFLEAVLISFICLLLYIYILHFLCNYNLQLVIHSIKFLFPFLNDIGIYTVPVLLGFMNILMPFHLQNGVIPQYFLDRPIYCTLFLIPFYQDGCAHP